MVLKLANSRDVGNIESVPSLLDDFLNQYINKTQSLEFAEQENKLVHPQDGMFLKDGSNSFKVHLIFHIPKYIFRSYLCWPERSSRNVTRTKIRIKIPRLRRCNNLSYNCDYKPKKSINSISPFR